MRVRHRTWVVAACLGSTAATLAPTARAEEPRTIAPAPESPPGPTRDPLLIVTGAVLLGVPYGGSVAAGLSSENPADRWLLVPVVGPLADYAARATCQTYGCRGSDYGGVALPLAIDAGLQAAGAIVLVRALTAPARAASPPTTGIRVLPAPTLHGAGVTAVGTF